MKKILCLNLMLLCSQATHAQINHGMHQDGPYLGTRIGFNFSKVSSSSFSAETDRHGTTTQELMGGYLFSPDWAIETGVGSYFSSLGLGARVAVKKYFPVSKKWSLSVQGGGTFIETPLENGFFGPYIGAGAEYAINNHITVNINARDLFASTEIFGDTTEINGNFITGLIGFSYYV